MYLEQEVYSLLLFAFLAVFAVSALLLVMFYLRFRNRRLAWFGGQLGFLALAFYYFYQCVTCLPSPGDSMYSEEQSLTLALSGVCWALSMALCLTGVYRLSKPPRGDK